MRRHHILIPLAALLATLPLIFHGCSCGHDFDFHLQSWLDAAQQMRHGTLYPRWAFSAAWSAGEPRFLFYPPLSWMLGALLTLVLPVSAAPVVFTFVALSGAGFAMYRLAREFVGENAAVVAAVVYLANPYMLFNAFERTAYAELLAATWIPLLFLGVLKKKPSVVGIAVPLALLWLTNAPAAVMGTYAFALLAAVRLIRAWRETRLWQGQLVGTCGSGFALGLALPAFYLIPAAYERRYVQIAMAIIPNMRVQDNFLFGHTADAPHNLVLRTASLLAVSLLGVTFAAALALALRREETDRALRLTMLGTTVLIAFLLVPLSTPVWLHLPELAFLQFPWRMLTVLSAVLGLTLALLLGGMREQRGVVLGVSLVCPVVLSLFCNHLYRQRCERGDLPVSVARAFRTHHGVAPTDEYTPAQADNDFLRADDPAYWLSTDPQAFAPGTVANPAATDPNYNSDTLPADTLSAEAPHRLELELPRPLFLVLNLRDFADWRVTANGNAVTARVQRDDGLMAFALPSGASTVDIRWRYGWDQELGFAVSGVALVVTWLGGRKVRELGV
jgi:hypothetical protein